MAEYPLTLSQIVEWFRSKQDVLMGSDVPLADIKQRIEHVPAAAADFDGVNATGRITGWVSGAFDFEVIRGIDGQDIFWRHLDMSTVDALESAYLDFVATLRTCLPSSFLGSFHGMDAFRFRVPDIRDYRKPAELICV